MVEVLLALAGVIFFTCNILAALFPGGLRDKLLVLSGLIDDKKGSIDTQLILSKSLFFNLIACPICIGSWIAIIVGGVFIWLFHLPLWFLAASFFAPQYVVWKLF